MFKVIALLLFAGWVGYLAGDRGNESFPEDV